MVSEIYLTRLLSTKVSKPVVKSHDSFNDDGDSGDGDDGSYDDGGDDDSDCDETLSNS